MQWKTTQTCCNTHTHTHINTHTHIHTNTQDLLQHTHTHTHTHIHIYMQDCRLHFVNLLHYAQLSDNEFVSDMTCGTWHIRQAAKQRLEQRQRCKQLHSWTLTLYDLTTFKVILQRSKWPEIPKQTYERDLHTWHMANTYDTWPTHKTDGDIYDTWWHTRQMVTYMTHGDTCDRWWQTDRWWRQFQSGTGLMLQPVPPLRPPPPLLSQSGTWLMSHPVPPLRPPPPLAFPPLSNLSRFCSDSLTWLITGGGSNPTARINSRSSVACDSIDELTAFICSSSPHISCDATPPKFRSWRIFSKVSNRALPSEPNSQCLSKEVLKTPRKFFRGVFPRFSEEFCCSTLQHILFLLQHTATHSNTLNFSKVRSFCQKPSKSYDEIWR